MTCSTRFAACVFCILITANLGLLFGQFGTLEENVVDCIPPTQAGGGGALVLHTASEILIDYYDDIGTLLDTTSESYLLYDVDVGADSSGTYTWTVTAVVNPDWPDQPSGGPANPLLPYVLDLHSGAKINVTNSGGGTIVNTGTNIQIEWAAAPGSFILAGTIDASSPTYLNINSVSSGNLQVTFTSPGTDPCSGGPGPVCCPGPPTAPPRCEAEGSQGIRAASGYSAFSPLSFLQSYGDRIDYDGTPRVSSGCITCSGTSGGIPIQTTKPSINIARILAPSEITHHSSFGLGWFSKTDFDIDFFVGDDNKHRLILFDPITEKVIEMIDPTSGGAPSGVFKQEDDAGDGTGDLVHQQYFTKLELLNGETDVLTIPSVHDDQTPNSSMRAKLYRRNGWVYEFQVIDIHPEVNPAGSNPIDPAARLEKITSPYGFSIDIVYNGPTEFPNGEISDDPLRQFQVKDITDGYNNQAVYTYDPLQMGGRWVTTKIEVNGGSSSGGETLDYGYDTATGRLHTVKRNSLTIATYHYGEHSPWSADKITAEEITPDGPKVTDTIYLSQDNMIFDGLLINQYSARLLGRADGDSVVYLRVSRNYNQNGEDDQVYRVEHRGRLFDWSFGTSLKYYTSYTIVPAQNPFDSYQNLVAESTFPAHGTVPTFSLSVDQILRAEPASSRDATGYETKLTYDDAGNVEVIEHLVNGVMDSFEKFFFDDENNLIMHRDREGYGTAYEYDDASVSGRLVRISRGLVDTETSPASSTFQIPNDPMNLNTINPVAGESTSQQFNYIPFGSEIKEGLLQSTGMAYYTQPDIENPPSISSEHLTVYEYYDDIHPTSPGRLKRIIKPKPAGVATEPYVTYSWDENRVYQIDDEEDEITKFTYDAIGRLTRTEFTGSTEDTWYDDDNFRIYKKDRNDIVSVRQWDSAGRLQVSAQAYGTDEDLSDHAIDHEPIDIGNPFNIDPGVASVTRYTYMVGRNQPSQSSTNRRFTSFEYDYRGRTVQSRQSIGSASDYRQTVTTYLDNRVFKVGREMQNGSDSFVSNTYRGYSPDGTTVRIIECRDSLTSFSGNAAVMAESRPNDLSDNAFRIIDRITDMRGVTVRVVNERDAVTDYDVDSLSRVTDQHDGRQDNGGSIDDTYILTSTTKYDFRGNPMETTDSFGNHTVMTYDNAGNLKTRTVANGHSSIQMTWEYKYDAKSRRIEERLPSTGVNYTYYSDCCGRQQGSVNALGNKQVTVMNDGGQVVFNANLIDSYTGVETSDYSLIAASDKLSETTRRYDDAGRLQYQTRWRFAQGSFDPDDPPIAGLGSIAANQGVTTQYAYINQIPKTLFSMGPTTVEVDVESLIGGSTVTIKITDAIGLLTTNGVVLSNSRAGSANIIIAPDEKTYSYTISDSLGRTVMTGLSYGPEATEGSFNDMIDWTITKYDSSDTVGTLPVEAVTTKNVENYETRTLNDAYGWTVEARQVGQLTGGGDAITRTDFDVSGNPLKVTDANGNETDYTYDLMSRQTSMTVDPDNLALTTSTVYFLEADADTTDADPANHVRRTGLVKQTTDARNNSIDFELEDYDVLGRLTKVRDRMDAVVSGGNNYTLRVYDTKGNLVTVTDANNKTTTYGYDLLGRKTSTMYHDGKEQVVNYDDMGRMKEVLSLGSNESSTNQNEGLERVYKYKYSGVVEEIIFTNNRTTGSSDKHLFGYDDFLRKISSENEIDNVARTFTYNDRGQLKTEKLDFDTNEPSSTDLTTSYDYDDLGRLQSITYPDSGHSVSYTYTDRSQLETVTWDTGTPNPIESRDYDGAGRLTDIDRNQFDEVRTYDEANRLLTIDNQKSGASTQVGKLTYSYDDNGNKQSETWSDGPSGMSDWDFKTTSTSGDYQSGYDEEDRLRRFIRDWSGTPIEAKSTAYLDRGESAGTTIGNIVSITGGANIGHDGNRGYSNIYELTSLSTGSLSQVYNIDGQVSTMHNGNALQQWDASGRLKKVYDGTDTYEYGYDCDGRRVWKKKTNTPTTTTVYCYGGPNVISEFNTSGTTVELDKEFVYGTTIDELLLVDLPITLTRPTAKAHGVTRNQQWSIMSVYDHSSGTVKGRFNYDIFGKRFVLNADGTYATNQDQDFEIPYGYTSRRHDYESDLMYFRARYYDPTTGEFVSQDPRQYVDGMSLYRGYFVPNGVDPTGKDDRGFNNCFCRGYQTPNARPRKKLPCKEKDRIPRINPKTGKPYKPVVNGCTLSPDNPARVVSFRPACNRHDVCYTTCGKTKKQCDDQFYWDMIGICSTVKEQIITIGPWDVDVSVKGECAVWAYVYYQSVAAAPPSLFWDPTQFRHCCCKKETR